MTLSLGASNVGSDLTFLPSLAPFARLLVQPSYDTRFASVHLSGSLVEYGVDLHDRFKSVFLLRLQDTFRWNCNQSNTHAVMGYHRILWDGRHQFSEWDVCMDFIFTSCKKYLLCRLRCLYQFYCYQKKLWRYEDDRWFHFNRNSEGLGNLNRFMFVLHNCRQFKWKYRGHVGLSSSSQYHNWCQMRKYYLVF